MEEGYTLTTQVRELADGNFSSKFLVLISFLGIMCSPWEEQHHQHFLCFSKHWNFLKNRPLFSEEDKGFFSEEEDQRK